MIELAILFVGLSLLLYVVLGGADFGAGIIEIFSDKKNSKTISNAIAPIWEANHIWLIVVIVVLFNAFPEVYSTVTLYLHIPLMLVLLGIIFRGTAFTFRYYDPYKDKTHTIYTFIFKLFSVLTPFFLGVTLGATILGRIKIDMDESFYTLFMAPWLNWFSVALGLFVVLLFAFLASAYMSGEPLDEKTKKYYINLTKKISIALVIMGGLVFLSAQWNGLKLIERYLSSYFSLSSLIIATLLLPLLFYGLKKENSNMTRVIAVLQTFSVMIGWFAIQFPVMVEISGAESLTVDNAAAPYKTVFYMVVALIGGLILVIPLFGYLFKVFKFSS